MGPPGNLLLAALVSICQGQPKHVPRPRSNRQGPLAADAATRPMPAVDLLRAARSDGRCSSVADRNAAGAWLVSCDPGLMTPEAALAEVNHAILEGLPERKLRLLIARHVQSVLGAATVAICTPAAVGSGYAVRTALGLGAEGLRGWSIDAKVAMADGPLAQGRRPKVIALDAGPWPSCLPSSVAGELGPALLVPVSVNDQTRGILLVAKSAGARSFVDGELALAQVFGAQAAIAIDFREKLVATEHLRVIEDRERISGEVHDSVAQRLFGVALSLQGALPPAEHPELRRQLEEAIRGLDEVVAKLRGLLDSQARPALLHDRGLEMELLRMASQFADRGHVAIQVDVEQGAAAAVSGHSEKLRAVLYERLSDVVRRADVRRCFVRLYLQADRGILEVTDDGRGVHAEHERLRELRDLLALPGGDVELHITPEIGTMFRATVVPERNPPT